MIDLILYFVQKYHGNWDAIYNAVSHHEPVDWQEIKNNVKNKYSLATWISDDKYPDKLKNIYMPPFILYYCGNLLKLNERVIGFVGQFHLEEVQCLLVNEMVNYCFCWQEEDLSSDIYDYCSVNQIPLIVICKNKISEFKFFEQQYAQLLLLSENNDEVFEKGLEQTKERLIYGISDLLILQSHNVQRLTQLKLNYEYNPKLCCCLETERRNIELRNVFNNHEIKFLKNYDDVIIMN